METFWISFLLWEDEDTTYDCEYCRAHTRPKSIVLSSKMRPGNSGKGCLAVTAVLGAVLVGRSFAFTGPTGGVVLGK